MLKGAGTRYLAVLVIIVCMLFTGCTIKINGEDIDVGRREKETASDEITMEKVKAVKADINNNVGSIYIKYSEDDTLKIKVDFEVTGNDEDDLKEILEAAKVSAEAREDEIEITVINKDSGDNIWRWIEDEYRGIINKPSLDVDLDIELPAGVREYDIVCNVGNVKLNALKGIFDVRTNVGEVKLNDIIFTGDSDITTDVGDLNCSLGTDTGDASDISLTVNVGNITLDTNGLDYDSGGKEDKDFVGASKEITVAGIYEFDCRVSVGGLSID